LKIINRIPYTLWEFSISWNTYSSMAHSPTRK